MSKRGAEPLVLCVYDISIPLINSVLFAFNHGFYHTSVLYGGYEWSYGSCEEGTGVYRIPEGQEDKNERCRVVLKRHRGVITMIDELWEETKTDFPGGDSFYMALATITPQFPGSAYNILNYNCVTFCRSLALELGVSPSDFPTWIDRTAAFGRAFESLPSYFSFDFKREKGDWLDIPDAEEISYPSTDVTSSLPSTGTESPSSSAEKRKSSVVRGCADKVSSFCCASPKLPASGSPGGSGQWTATRGSGGSLNVLTSHSGGKSEGASPLQLEEVPLQIEAFGSPSKSNLKPWEDGDRY